MRLLVVDWDYFFHNRLQAGDDHWPLYDWGHAESPFFIELIWPIRASGFIRNGIELPGTTGQQHNFWDSFQFMPGADTYFAESNSAAAHVDVAADVTEVWLYDAHHDAGYHSENPDELAEAGVWSCENWMMLYYCLGADLHVRYPTWRWDAFDAEPEPAVRIDRQIDNEDNRPTEVKFDRVFVCRSGAWVPPWLDQEFFAFLNDCPADGEEYQVGGYDVVQREFNLEQAQGHADLVDRHLDERSERTPTADGGHAQAAGDGA